MVNVQVRPTFWAVTGVKEDDWSEGVVTEVSSGTRLALGLGRLVLVGARHTPHWLVTAQTAEVAWNNVITRGQDTHLTGSWLPRLQKWPETMLSHKVKTHTSLARDCPDCRSGLKQYHHTRSRHTPHWLVTAQTAEVAWNNVITRGQDTHLTGSWLPRLQKWPETMLSHEVKTHTSLARDCPDCRSGLKQYHHTRSRHTPHWLVTAQTAEVAWNNIITRGQDTHLTGSWLPRLQKWPETISSHEVKTHTSLARDCPDCRSGLKQCYHTRSRHTPHWLVTAQTAEVAWNNVITRGQDTHLTGSWLPRLQKWPETMLSHEVKTHTSLARDCPDCRSGLKQCYHTRSRHTPHWLVTAQTAEVAWNNIITRGQDTHLTGSWLPRLQKWPETISSHEVNIHPSLARDCPDCRSGLKQYHHTRSRHTPHWLVNAQTAEVAWNNIITRGQDTHLTGSWLPRLQKWPETISSHEVKTHTSLARDCPDCRSGLKQYHHTRSRHTPHWLVNAQTAEVAWNNIITRGQDTHLTGSWLPRLQKWPETISSHEVKTHTSLARDCPDCRSGLKQYHHTRSIYTHHWLVTAQTAEVAWNNIITWGQDTHLTGSWLPRLQKWPETISSHEVKTHTSLARECPDCRSGLKQYHHTRSRHTPHWLVTAQTAEVAWNNIITWGQDTHLTGSWLPRLQKWPETISSHEVKTHTSLARECPDCRSGLKQYHHTRSRHTPHWLVTAQTAEVAWNNIITWGQDTHLTGSWLPRLQKWPETISSHEVNIHPSLARDCPDCRSGLKQYHHTRKRHTPHWLVTAQTAEVAWNNVITRGQYR